MESIMKTLEDSGFEHITVLQIIADWAIVQELMSIDEDKRLGWAESVNNYRKEVTVK